jgi:hypothetical protein
MRQLPVRMHGATQIPLQVNEILNHPMGSLENVQHRDRWRYRFLRTTRVPTVDRPESGRILVENVVSGKRTEHYAMLFGVGFKVT